MPDDVLTARCAEPAPTFFFLVGLPGSGKTTRAWALEHEYAALRLTPDDWILALYGPNLDRTRRDVVREPVEALQWSLAQRALALGCNVILDWGFWLRAERDHYRQQATARGAMARLIFFDAPLDELWARITRRPESRDGTLEITREELDIWASWFEPLDPEELAHVER